MIDPIHADLSRAERYLIRQIKAAGFEVIHRAPHPEDGSPEVLFRIGPWLCRARAERGNEVWRFSLSVQIGRCQRDYLRAVRWLHAVTATGVVRLGLTPWAMERHELWLFCSWLQEPGRSAPIAMHLRAMVSELFAVEPVLRSWFPALIDNERILRLRFRAHGDEQEKERLLILLERPQVWVALGDADPAAATALGPHAMFAARALGDWPRLVEFAARRLAWLDQNPGPDAAAHRWEEQVARSDLATALIRLGQPAQALPLLVTCCQQLQGPLEDEPMLVNLLSETLFMLGRLHELPFQRSDLNDRNLIGCASISRLWACMVAARLGDRAGLDEHFRQYRRRVPNDPILLDHLHLLLDTAADNPATEPAHARA